MRVTSGSTRRRRAASKALAKPRMAPGRLSSSAAAAPWLAPSALRSSAVSSRRAGAPPATMAWMAGPARRPSERMAASAPSPAPARPSSASPKSSVRMPSSPSSLRKVLAGSWNCRMALRSAVPPRLPRKPASASRPISAAVCSMSIPAWRATGATKVIASPSCAVVWADLCAARVNTSDTRAASSLARPNAFSAVVTWIADSATVWLLPAASCSTGFSVSIASLAFCPDRANSSRPFAASVAVKRVVAPASSAAARSASISSAVAWVTAPTVDIASSNSPAERIAPAKKRAPTTAVTAVAAAVTKPKALASPLATPPSRLSPLLARSRKVTRMFASRVAKRTISGGGARG